MYYNELYNVIAYRLVIYLKLLSWWYCHVGVYVYMPIYIMINIITTPLDLYLTPPMKGLYKYKYQRRTYVRGFILKKLSCWLGRENIRIRKFPTKTLENCKIASEPLWFSN